MQRRQAVPIAGLKEATIQQGLLTRKLIACHEVVFPTPEQGTTLVIAKTEDGHTVYAEHNSL